MRARDNPFAVHRVLRVRYRLDDTGWTSLFAALERSRYRGSIVGAHGSGKTTLLEDLGERLRARGWHVRFFRFDATHRTLPRWTRGARYTQADFVLCDGVEQLSAIDAMRLRWRTRQAGGLVVTSHDERWPPVLMRCRPDAHVLRDVVASLGVSLEPHESIGLIERHRGNVREAIRELYDRVATSDEYGR